MAQFPVFSLMIREFDAENGSQQTVPSANQYSIFALFAENCKIAHQRLRAGRAKHPFDQADYSQSDARPTRRSAAPGHMG
jgi:hypothetical protein